jgi:hypothetical protein
LDEAKGYIEVNLRNKLIIERPLIIEPQCIIEQAEAAIENNYRFQWPDSTSAVSLNDGKLRDIEGRLKAFIGRLSLAIGA